MMVKALVSGGSLFVGRGSVRCWGGFVVPLCGGVGDLDLLPRASLEGKLGGYSGVVVNGRVVGVVGRKYVLVQHKFAFAPVLGGVERLCGFGLWCDWRYADCYVYCFRDVGLLWGFGVRNRLDGRGSVRYLFGDHFVDLFGFSIENNCLLFHRLDLRGHLVGSVLNGRVSELFRRAGGVVHYRSVKKKSCNVKYVLEAVGLLEWVIGKKVGEARGVKASDVQLRLAGLKAGSVWDCYISLCLKAGSVGNMALKRMWLGKASVLLG
jgi:hypothetical protein